MKTITRTSLNELAKVMPVLSEREQSSFVGGGTGSSSDPYSRSEYDSLLESGNWTGGFVLMRDDGTYSALQFVPASDGSDGSGGFSNLQNPIMGLYCTGMVPSNSGSGLVGSGGVDGYDFIDGEWFFVGSGSVNDSGNVGGSGIVDGSGTVDSQNSEYEKMLSSLTDAQRNLIKEQNLKITVDSNLQNKSGQYNAGTKEITINSNDPTILKRELIHAFQDSKGMLSSGASTSNAEFQEHLLGDLMLFSDSSTGGSYGTSQSDGYMDWMEKSVMKDGFFNKDVFVNGFQSRFGEFQQKFKENSNYSKPLDPNYNWNWNEMFNFCGIK